MRTGLTFWVLAIATFLLLAGLLLLQPTLIALVIPVILYLALGSVFGPSKAQLKVTRIVPRDHASLGDQEPIALIIENQGPSMEMVEFYDALPPEVELVEGSNYLVATLGRGRVVELTYTITPRMKGELTLGPLLVRNRDNLGFFLEEEIVEDTATISVTPGREDIRRLEVTTRRLRPRLGRMPSRSPGLGTDFWAIRDYSPGDEMRKMNWKASARLDSLFTNEFEGERSGDFVIILDARAEAALGPYHESAVEMGVRAAVSLAETLLEGRNRVGLIVMRSVLDWVYPAFGRRQLLKITDALVRVRPGGQWTLRHLPWLLGRFFPPASQLIVISPIIDSPTRDALAGLKARGFDVIVVSPSVVDIEASTLEATERVEVARSILQLEREANIALLRQFARVADWKPDDPLALSLKEVEEWKLPLQ